MRLQSQAIVFSPAMVLGCLACPAIAASPVKDSVASHALESRVCGTPDVTAQAAAAIQADLESRTKGRRIGGTVGGLVPVALHVIHDGVEGNVTDAQIEAQIDELNLDFSGACGGYDTGYRFVLASLDRTDEPDWFTMVQNSIDERRAKRTLGVDPMHHVNIYTAKIDAYGWSSFPWGVAEDEEDQGIVIHYGTLPGGHLTNFNLGRTATHEIGHYFGLFHTFFMGCDVTNDFVEDTPAEATPASGCPDSMDTCSSPGPDPIHNYMDYSDDTCYREFTTGQDDRMDEMVATYRPNLIAAPLAVKDPPPGERVAFGPVIPNPATGSIALRFALPREEWVSLRIHDLAGRRVGTVVDGVMPAGEHRAVWEPASRSGGIYFVVLGAGGARMVRRFAVTR